MQRWETRWSYEGGQCGPVLPGRRGLWEAGKRLLCAAHGQTSAQKLAHHARSHVPGSWLWTAFQNVQLEPAACCRLSRTPPNPEDPVALRLRYVSCSLRQARLGQGGKAGSGALDKLGLRVFLARRLDRKTIALRCSRPNIGAKASPPCSQSRPRLLALDSFSECAAGTSSLLPVIQNTT